MPIENDSEAACCSPSNAIAMAFGLGSVVETENKRQAIHKSRRQGVP